MPLERSVVEDCVIRFVPQEVVDPRTRMKLHAAAERVPQLLWDSGEFWSEANLWLLARTRLLLSGKLSEDTIGANGKDLLAYAGWLEQSGMQWWQCPPLDDQRPLNLYRGHLVDSHEKGVIAPTLASRRMSTLKAFYRWLLKVEILSPGFPLWSERNVRIAYEDAFGFRRHVEAVQTSLDIKAAKRVGEAQLEEGLQPVSLEVRDAILDLAHRRCSHEMFLMLSLGFWSGLRLGTVCDLKIQTIENATTILNCDALKHISVGPQANPQVQMKLDQSSNGIVVPTRLLEELSDYSISVTRGKRAALAKPEHKHLLFLTKYGNPYGAVGSDRSPTVNAEMSRLKRLAREEGLNINDFTFHWSRATFATMWATVARANGYLHQFMPTLKRMLAHKHDRTTERYIRWVEREEVRAAVMDAFTKTMFGPFIEKEREQSA
ncbi:tyrosine-type recombinase/integrase [Solilutibacter silvestris]|uniref:Phage integrase-related protein n=1 Tax=Solilutibacter silvestris TaxID=1645665 RepID=A0A2K1Q434_9GAMM|nr:site-specific integrase [Lysobacter silvestris]PNS09761.1 Phage integrase-related protein [Lysobacter silvestris]